MLAPALAVFAAALLHEDVALLTAAFCVQEHDVSPLLTFALIVTGTIGNSLLLYGVGTTTRNHAWVRRWLLSARVRALAERIERRLVTTIVLARLSQGLATPTLIGCGWLGAPLARVAGAVALSAVLYVAPMLTLVIVFGAPVIGALAQAGWLALAVVLCLIAVLAWHVRPCQRTARRDAGGAAREVVDTSSP
jgi:membrane protein DedA with SNARE-associated domain